MFQRNNSAFKETFSTFQEVYSTLEEVYSIFYEIYSFQKIYFYNPYFIYLKILRIARF